MPILLTKSQEWISRGAGVKTAMVVGGHMGAAGISMGQGVIDPGAKLVLHYHSMEESIMITEGNGTAVCGSESQAVGPGDTLLAPAKVPHQLINNGQSQLKFIFAYPTREPDRFVVE